MAARTKSPVAPKNPTAYRAKCGPAYQAALGVRGDVTAWLDADAVAKCGKPAHRGGGPPSVARGGGRPSAGPGRERELPVRAVARGRPPGAEARRAQEAAMIAVNEVNPMTTLGTPVGVSAGA